MQWKCCTQYASKFGKLNSGHRTEKHHFSFQSQRKAIPKNAQTTALISHTSKVMLKFSKPGFNSIWTVNFQMFKLDLVKAEDPEIKLPTSVGSSKKQKSSRKTPTSALCQNFWLCGSQQTGKFLKRWEYQTTWPTSWEIYMQVRKQQLELDTEQQTGSK